MTKLRIEAPADWDALQIAQAVVGDRYLLKADIQPKSRTPFLAMQELEAKVLEGYRFLLAKMVEAIEHFIEQEVLEESLGKAIPTMDRLMLVRPLLTPAQLQALERIIADYHLAAVAGLVHPSMLTISDFQRLVDSGVISSDLKYVVHPKAHELPPERVEFTDSAYDYGRSLIPVETYERDRGMRAPTLSLETWEKARVKQPPHSAEEKHAMEWARNNAALHIRNLGATISHEIATAVSEEDAEIRKRYTQAVRDKLEENIKRRESWRKLASEIGHATEDWSKGLGRIAATERARATQEGIVSGLKGREKRASHSIFVARVPTPDACPDCVRLHLTAGQGSKPKVFRLSELEANGSNVGRKRSAWKTVVGPIHPWCECRLVHIPDGWEYNEEGFLAPIGLTRGEFLDYDLRKGSIMTFGDSVPERGVSIRVSDPAMRVAVEEVVARTPPEVFDRNVGVTLITTDSPRAQNPLEEHDLAYWTGNEIRIMQTLPAERIARVLPHEIAHSLNVYLCKHLGSVSEVRDWHKSLWKLSKKEGYVSKYAQHEPIENAAEVTMVYLYDRNRLMLEFPKQFAFCHAAYRDIFTPKPAVDLLVAEDSEDESDAAE